MHVSIALQQRVLVMHTSSAAFIVLCPNPPSPPPSASSASLPLASFRFATPPLTIACDLAAWLFAASAAPA